MNEKRLRIEPRRYVESSVVVSMRIPKDMLRDLTGRTRNEIISMSLEYALKHMDIEQK